MANNVVKGIGAVTIVVSVVTAVLLPTPGESSKLVEYQARCHLAHAFLVTQLPIAAKKAKLPSMYFTPGEAWRPTWVAKTYAAKGMGIAQSLHTKRLAFDNNLVLGGKVTFDPKDYVLAGLIWEKIGPVFGIKPAWGGRFSSVDAVHFSCEWEGYK